MDLMRKFRDQRGAISNGLVAIVIILLIVVIILQLLSIRESRRNGQPAASITEQAGKTAADVGIGGPTSTKPGPTAAAVVKEAGGDAKEVTKETVESAKTAVGSGGK
jgi:hypothetical protein